MYEKLLVKGEEKTLILKKYYLIKKQDGSFNFS